MDNRTNRYVTILAVVAIVISALFISLLFLGYGSIKIDVPSNVSVQINGHPVAESKMRLRSGSYTFLATSPNYAFDYSQVKVPLFGTANYKPSLKPRDATSILTSSIVVDGVYGKPGFKEYKWFENNTWVAGQLNISGNFIALNYQNSRWNVAYYEPGGNYSDSTSKLPSDVVSYINAQREAYGQQQH